MSSPSGSWPHVFWAAVGAAEFVQELQYDSMRDAGLGRATEDVRVRIFNRRQQHEDRLSHRKGVALLRVGDTIPVEIPYHSLHELKSFSLAHAWGVLVWLAGTTTARIAKPFSTAVTFFLVTHPLPKPCVQLNGSSAGARTGSESRKVRAIACFLMLVLLGWRKLFAFQYISPTL